MERLSGWRSHLMTGLGAQLSNDRGDQWASPPPQSQAILESSALETCQGRRLSTMGMAVLATAP